MEQEKVNMFIGLNHENFNPTDLMLVKERIEKMDDAQFYFVQGITLQNPTTVLLIAIFLGWDRFWLGEIGLGILKIMTAYGCGIWWLIDIFTAQNRTRKYNYKKFTEMVMMY